MNQALTQLLRCPFCHSSFQASGDGPTIQFGLLTCRCRRYPVVGGIPIIRTGTLGSCGESVDDVVRWIERRRYREALLAALMPPPPHPPALAPRWLRDAPPFKGWWRITHFLHARRVSAWRREMAAALLQIDPAHTTAQYCFDLYFRRSGNRQEGYNYFLFRHGMPRHLVALSMMTLVPQRRGPVLDLACGFGHLTRSLAQRNPGGVTVGVDRVFFCLYVAASLIGRNACYVCVDLEQPMPFAPSSFSTIFCSDAFHYVEAKASLLRTLTHLLDHTGLLLIVSMRNSLVPQHHSCLSMSPRDYAALVPPVPYRLVSDQAILERYLQGFGPPLAQNESWETLNGRDLVSLVMTRDTKVFRDHGPFEAWPHASGRLHLNPLYQPERANGNIRLRRMFPSEHYEKENDECKTYLPESLTVAPALLDALRAGVPTDSIEELVKCCVALDMPDAYLTADH